jgi:hypothetical protein
MDLTMNIMALSMLGGEMAKIVVEAAMLVLPCALVAMVMLKIMR